ncbi:MAG: GatB/YqeY domain-containing protein [Gemmatimonadales bacterium]|nr:MAG: GatB/YqeY domain-containing protein [Gemmatimonadales bacterium]
MASRRDPGGEIGGRPIRGSAVGDILELTAPSLESTVANNAEQSAPDELKVELRSALDQARRDRDRLRTTVLSSVLSEIHNREIEVGGELDREQIHEVLSRGTKQRREAAEQMRAGNREELALKEEAESEILSEFLPPALDEAEVRRMVRELMDSGVTEIGPLMGRLMPRLKGRFDGKDANRIVREEFSG